MKFVPVTEKDFLELSKSFERTKLYSILEDFVNSDLPIAELTDFKSSVEVQSTSLRSSVKRFKEPVKIMVRKNRIFLIRTDLVPKI